MATKEEAAAERARLLSALDGLPEEYVFLIPDGLDLDAPHALGRVYVAHKVDHKAKRVYLKRWESGETIPIGTHLTTTPNKGARKNNTSQLCPFGSGGACRGSS